MNLAARLMMLGEGVRCDAATARAARDEVALGPVQPLRLKGFAAAIPVREVVERTRRPAQPLVGREDTVANAVARLGGSGVAAFVGEAGAGKTAVLEAIAAIGAGRGVRVIRAAGSPARAHVAGAGLAEAVRAALNPHDALAPLLGPALGEAWPDSPQTATIRGFARAEATADLLIRLVGPGPALLVADDAQWLDGPSLSAITRLAAGDLLALVGARTGKTGPGGELAGLLAGAVALDALDAGAVASLARARLGGATLPDGLVEWLLAQAAGNPLFTLELLAVAQDRGFLELDAAGRVLYFDRAGLERSAPPETVRAAIVARLDSLSPAAFILLKAASTVGEVVHPSALAAVAPPPGRDPGALDELADGGWLTPHPDGTLRFANGTVRESVHDLLVPADLRRLHGALARWLRGVDPAPPGRDAALSEHLAHAGETDAAMACLQVACADAMRAGLGRNAAQFALRALALDAAAAEHGTAHLDATSRAHWRLRVALACREFGDTDLAAQHLALAASELDLRLPTSAAGWKQALAKHAALHLLEMALPTLLLLGRGDRASLQASVLNLTSLTGYLRSLAPETWVTTALWAVRLGRRSPTPAPTALAASMVAIVLGRLPWVADRYLDAALAQARRLSDPREELDATLGRLILDLIHGRWAAADSRVAASLPQLAAHRNYSLHAVFLGLFGCSDLLSGRVDRCAARCADMVRLGEHEGYLQARGWARNLEASLALLAGEYAAAQGLADEARTILDRRLDPDRLSSRALHAQATRLRGDLPGAVSEIVALEALFPAEATMSLTGLETYGIPPEVHLHALLADPHDAGARSRADAALATFRTFAAQAPIAKPRLATLNALRNHALGRDALPAARDALRLAERWQMPIERLRALELLALLGEPREAQAAGLRAELAQGWREG